MKNQYNQLQRSLNNSFNSDVNNSNHNCHNNGLDNNNILQNISGIYQQP